MSGKYEKAYIKIKDKLESLNTRLIGLEKEIHELIKDLKNNKIENGESKNVLNKNSKEVNKNQYKKKKIYFLKLFGFPIIIFITLFSLLLGYYYYKNKNAIIVLEGMPQSFTCKSFKGNLGMYPKYINIDSGKIVNQSYMKVIVDNQEFEVKPGDFIIVFDCNKNKDIYGIPYANNFRTSNKNIRISTNTNSDYYATASHLLFKRGNNVTEYEFNNLFSENSQSEYIDAENFITNGLMEIQDQDKIICTGGMYIYINGKDIVKNDQFGKEIQLCNMNTGLSMSFNIQFQKCTFYFSNTNGISMNGTISGFSGRTGMDNSKMIYTSLNEQKSYDIGGLDVAGEGKDINITYNFDSTNNIIKIIGKINKLELYGINIKEGIYTFIYSNWTNIFSAMIAAILASIIVNVLNKQNDEG